MTLNELQSAAINHRLKTDQDTIEALQAKVRLYQTTLITIALIALVWAFN